MSKRQSPDGMASESREYGTIELFEQYWVRGESTAMMDVGASTLKQRGIPTRSAEDAQQYMHGNVTLEELWEKYLSTFQIKLAQELRALRLRGA